eukprot:GHVL01027325.1.p1 GENE.GHVL01027325.1~~GHVL01027325.1.p1  ORF type:complete len:1051 (+),score=213.93 GHVL01027325.1:376-3153(+)
MRYFQKNSDISINNIDIQPWVIDVKLNEKFKGVRCEKKCVWEKDSSICDGDVTRYGEDTSSNILDLAQSFTNATCDWLANEKYKTDEKKEIFPDTYQFPHYFECLTEDEMKLCGIKSMEGFKKLQSLYWLCPKPSLSKTDKYLTTKCQCRVQCHPDSCLNAFQYTECNSYNCGLPLAQQATNCRNRAFTKKLFKNIKVVPTPGKGSGVMAQCNIAKGEFVYEYVGEVLNRDQWIDRAQQLNMMRTTHWYMMEMSHPEGPFIIDASQQGNIARYINHSCNPNCQADRWIVNGDSRIGITARRDIAIGEEICYNYRMESFGGRPSFECFCGAANCTTVLGVQESNLTLDKKTRELCVNQFIERNNPILVLQKLRFLTSLSVASETAYRQLHRSYTEEESNKSDSDSVDISRPLLDSEIQRKKGRGFPKENKSPRLRDFELFAASFEIDPCRFHNGNERNKRSVVVDESRVMIDSCNNSEKSDTTPVIDEVLLMERLKKIEDLKCKCNEAAKISDVELKRIIQNPIVDSIIRSRSKDEVIGLTDLNSVSIHQMTIEKFALATATIRDGLMKAVWTGEAESWRGYPIRAALFQKAPWAILSLATNKDELRLALEGKMFLIRNHKCVRQGLCREIQSCFRSSATRATSMLVAKLFDETLGKVDEECVICNSQYDDIQGSLNRVCDNCFRPQHCQCPMIFKPGSIHPPLGGENETNEWLCNSCNDCPMSLRESSRNPAKKNQRLIRYMNRHVRQNIVRNYVAPNLKIKLENLKNIYKSNENVDELIASSHGLTQSRLNRVNRIWERIPSVKPITPLETSDTFLLDACTTPWTGDVTSVLIDDEDDNRRHNLKFPFVALGIESTVMKIDDLTIDATKCDTIKRLVCNISPLEDPYVVDIISKYQSSVALSYGLTLQKNENSPPKRRRSDILI